MRIDMRNLLHVKRERVMSGDRYNAIYLERDVLKEIQHSNAFKQCTNNNYVYTLNKEKVIFFVDKKNMNELTAN